MIGIIYVLSFISLLIAILGIRKINKAKLADLAIESYVHLVQTSLKRFNQRLLSILIQFFAITNGIYLGLSLLFDYSFSFKSILIFDGSILLFSMLVFILILFFPNIISASLNAKSLNQKQLLKSIIHAGLYQNLSFIGVFLLVLIIALLFFDSMGLISLCLGLIVTSFYFRSAGGAYKAAAEHQLESSENSSDLALTHPAQVLKSTGAIIASVGGLYLDVYGSWLISISAFFIIIAEKINPNSLFDLIAFPEVKWVLSIIALTSGSILFSFVFNTLRQQKKNIFLDIGYFIIGVTFIGGLMSAHYFNIEMFNSLSVMVLIMVLSMLGIIFFTNFLTSNRLSPIQFICKQAQYGAVNVLIASFFNGLVGNAIISLVLLLLMIMIYSYIGLIGLVMTIIYGLSIIVVACNVKFFSLISNQIIAILNHQGLPQNQHVSTNLFKISSSLEAIGNAFSSVAGILTSVVLFSAALFLNDVQLNFMSSQAIFAAGLGVIAINVFYALSISGTYETLVTSSKEIRRQLDDIPYINEANKAHPNMHRLGDKHAANGLKAVTLPGIWIIIFLSIIYFYLSNTGIYAALIGMFITVFVFSFFWSIFGDTLISVFNTIKQGRFGGPKTSVFSGVKQSFLYAHYFQWVLAPAGVIIMKLAGVIALIISVNIGG